MIKIERITEGTSATIERNGVRQRVFLNQLIDRQELDSMEVTGDGIVVYSIDEEVIEQKTSAGKTIEVPVQSEVAVIDEVVVETTTEVKQPEEKPAIVRPATRTVTKK